MRQSVEQLEPRRLFSELIVEGSQLSWLRQPTNGIAGRDETIIVGFHHASGDLLPSSPVQLSVNSGPNAGEVLGVALLRDGKAVFRHVVFDTAGSYSLEANAARTGPVISGAFLVSPAPAVKMEVTFSAYPLFNRDYGGIDVAMDILDRFGNLATNDQSNVRVRPGPSTGLAYFRAGIAAVSNYYPGQTVFANRTDTAVRFVGGVADFGIDASAASAGGAYVITPVTVILVDSIRHVPPVPFQMNAGP